MATDKKALRDRSDKMLEALDELRSLEQQKRREAISTPAFHSLASRITAKSREIFGLATRQEAIGDHTETGPESIDDLEATARKRDATT